MQQCSGCGATLQHDAPDEAGYLPLVKQQAEAVCRRCYRICHYGEFSRVAVEQAQYAAAVRDAIDQSDGILYVLDAFDLAGSVIRSLADLLTRQTVVAVVNKVDLLPHSFGVAALRDWVRQRLQATGVTVSDVALVSAERGSGVAQLMANLARTDAHRWCAVGAANVGKSSLLNRLLRSTPATNEALAACAPAPQLTTSRVPGTTLCAVAMPWRLSAQEQTQEQTQELVDTPGLLAGDRVTDWLCPTCLRQAVPQERLRPRVYQLTAGQTLFLGGFARIDFDAGERQPFVIYVSNHLVVHRTRRDRADDFAALHQDDLLVTPCATCRVGREQQTTWLLTSAFHQAGANRHARRLEIPTSGADVVLAGLGWVSVFGRRLQGRLLARGGVKVELRPRLLGSRATDPRRPAGSVSR